MIDVLALETWRDEDAWPAKISDTNVGQLIPLHQAFNALGKSKYGTSWSRITWRFRCKRQLGLDCDPYHLTDEHFDELAWSARLSFQHLLNQDIRRANEDLDVNHFSPRLDAIMRHIGMTFSEVHDGHIELWTNTATMMVNAMAQQRIRSFASEDGLAVQLPYSAWFIGPTARDARFAHGRISFDVYEYEPYGARFIYVSEADFDRQLASDEWELSADMEGAIRSMILEQDALHHARLNGSFNDAAPVNKEEAMERILARWPGQRELIDNLWADLKRDGRLRSLGARGKTKGASHQVQGAKSGKSPND
jgi:hypothetical protein